MHQTYQSIVVNAPIEQVWDTIKNFHDCSWAPNVITSCVPEGNRSGEEIGAKRILNNIFYETLTELNHKTHTIRYSIDRGPSPVSQTEVDHYIGHLHLLPVTKNRTTFVEWSSSWKAESNDAVEFCRNIYAALLNDLADSVEQTQAV